MHSQPQLICGIVLLYLSYPALDLHAQDARTTTTESSFESEAAKWGPTFYATTVLAPKDGAAKFNTFQRGGVQTIYTSEVLGHSPLTPERARHSPWFNQGMMIGFATGEKFDYRSGPIVHEQSLLDGSLPIVITRWSDNEGSIPLRYEETCFVRCLAMPIEIERGDENAAAMLALKITNGDAIDRIATVRMIVNASDNSQPRGYPALLYLGSLFENGNRAVNADGKTRLVWKTPPGTKVQTAFQGAAPKILEFGPTHLDGIVRPWTANEPAFTRYSATRTRENHQAHKAFDNFMPSYWTPETKMAAGPVGLGLEFPEQRQLRSVVVSWEASTSMPPANGYRLEGFDGTKWFPIAAQINGKPAEELRNHPEVVAEIGSNWLLAFDKPVLVKGFRIMIDELLGTAERPGIGAIEYNSAVGVDSNSGELIWTGSDSDFVANHVDFKIPVAAGQSETLYASLPFLPANEPETQWLAEANFSSERDRVATWWREYFAKGAKLELPEKYPVRVFEANLHHMMTTAERSSVTGHYITLTSLGWYEGVWASLSAMQVIALDERGFHEDAANYLEPFIAWQGTMSPPGEYKTREGFLSSHDDYTWVRWVSNHGFLLWAMADHYRFSADRKWLDRVLPNMLAAVDWIETERQRTKVLRSDGNKPPQWGLLPPGSTGDGAPNCYGFMGDAVTWRALDAVAHVLEEIDHPRAAAIRDSANEYKQSILTGVEWAREHTPLYTLKSGTKIPFIANDIYNVWKINTNVADPNVNFHIWWMDVGPLHLVDLGVLDPRSDLTGFLLQAAQDRWMKGNVTLAEPYYAPQRTAFLGRDEIEEFITMYYTLLAEGMDRQTFVTGEYHHGQQNLPVCDAEQSRIQRMMLVRENQGGIDFGSAIPRAWMRDGKRIALTEARTYYGKTSIVIESQAARGTITTTINTPDRKDVPLRLRVRHPDAKPIQSVTVNGHPILPIDVEGEWIKLPRKEAALKVVVTY